MHESRGISYTTAKDIIKKNLGIFFDDLRKLGTHSIRSGGASDPGCSHFRFILAGPRWMEMCSIEKQVH
jgi:hypothetical protein